ncbi:MAG: hypothetical protein KGQ46_10595 [Hyphomicrobiales bacterium]|nr:hypothetical protein [Hyphomicrobiales bacterium]MDE2115471.1 hypothetical protein [Hyphomicrobiales bacterium]
MRPTIVPIDATASHDPAQPAPKARHDLATALHLARIENAERSQVISELRGAEIARLEMLQEALAPLLAQVPKGIDIFDCALASGDHPRLFIDMIGFIEMARDIRTYRFVQDTRYGRIIVAESDKMDAIIPAARDYIARRMVEREAALASDQTIEQAARRLRAPTLAPEPVPAPPPTSAPAQPLPIKPRRPIWPVRLLQFIIEFLGVFTLTALLLWGAFAAYGPSRQWLGQQFPALMQPASPTNAPPKP